MPRTKKQPAAAAAAEPPPPQPPQPDTKPPRRIAPHIAQFAVPIRSITPAAKNARKHGAQNIDAIKASLQCFGQQRPVIINVAGDIIAGNGTHAAALALGWDTIAAATSDLAGDDITAFAIADNRTSELSEWDDEILRAQLADLADAGFDTKAMWADDDDLLTRVVDDPTGGLTDPNDVPAPPDEATTRPGDLWLLGDHRLLCGDSANAADVDRLLGGQQIHLVNTDPPYNVKVEPRSNNAIAAGLSSFPAADARNGGSLKHHQGLDLARDPNKAKATDKKLCAKDRPLANDSVSDEEFDRLLDAWFGNIARVLLPGRGFYIWGGYANCGNYPPFLKKHELYFSQAIIWVKEHPVLTRKDFMGNHEWCFYGWREGAGHVFLGPNNATDVWPIKKVNPQSMVHLTEKPVELAIRAMQYSSRPGENVLDLFGGSGSTLIAAQQTGRRAYLMELDPLYCDVIVQRWEKFTGRKAERRPAATSPAQNSPAQPAASQA